MAAGRTAEDIYSALCHLRKLKVGGDIPEVMIQNLVTPAAQNLEELSCMALLDGWASSEVDFRNLEFLFLITDPFPNLGSLHLCKIAQLSNRSWEDMGLLWEWDPYDDNDTLSEWAAFIKHTSQSLIYLTLEDRYLVNEQVCRHRGLTVDPGGWWVRTRSERDEGETGKQVK